ncbi:DUF6807 family protein, partial [Zhihengliuella sp.]|uniref:DUF6807 family protein n=1 Tax=Zhihengliuella sp. TaxID=1954483 RepID=UPI0028119B6D
HDGGGEPAEHSPRPFLHPVTTRSGRNVGDYRPADHAWHWGLGITVSNIAVAGQQYPVNLWGGPTYLAGQGYVQLPNNGSQRVIGSGLEKRVLHQRLEWCAADGSTFLHEERTWSADTVQAGGVEWLRTSVHSRWVNSSGGALAFGSPTTAGRANAGYGGFFLRLAASFDGAEIVAPTLAADSIGSKSTLRAERADSTLGTADPVGIRREEDAMGATADWLALRAGAASVLMVPAASNPGGPSPWFVRSTGTPMLCAAPFFHAEMHLGVDDAVDWQWTLLVADGPAPDVAIGAAAKTALAVGT